MTEFRLLPFQSLRLETLYAALALRSQVFVVEQGIVYLDPDGLDLQAHHVLVSEEERLIACARILPPGLKFPEPCIGRLVVHPDHRGRGLGRRVMQYAIDQTRLLYGHRPIIITAQSQLQRFYESMGYETLTAPYMLEGMLHVTMRHPAA